MDDITITKQIRIKSSLWAEIKKTTHAENITITAWLDNLIRKELLLCNPKEE